MASMVACAAACIRNPDWRRPQMSQVSIICLHWILYVPCDKKLMKMAQIILVLEGDVPWSDLPEGTPPLQSSSCGVHASRSRFFNRRRWFWEYALPLTSSVAPAWCSTRQHIVCSLFSDLALLYIITWMLAGNLTECSDFYLTVPYAVIQVLVFTSMVIAVNNFKAGDNVTQLLSLLYELQILYIANQIILGDC